MSLLDLTFRNVRRNFRLYTIYLVSMVIGVIIQFTFSSLMFNEDILAAISYRENFRNGVALASVVIYLFIIFFILYANSFFMRQRKKEFGTYLLFGMSERQITIMVFYETLFIGAAALAAGILLGSMLSKLFGMLLMNLMQYEQVITLSFPMGAIGTTAGLFLSLTLIISIHSFFAIKRVQLIELFHAKGRREKPIRYSNLLAGLSVLLLVSAFILVASGPESPVWQDYVLVSLIVVTIGIIGGTYLFFHQFAGWLLQLISRRKNYHEGPTVLWVSSLRFQIRSNALNLTFISLFSAVLLLLVCFVAINYKVQFEATGHNVPNGIAFQSLDDKSNAEIDLLIAGSSHRIQYHRSMEAIAVKPLTDLSAAFREASSYRESLLLVSEQTYNELVSLRNDKQLVDLTGDEAVVLAQGEEYAKNYAAGEKIDFEVQAAKAVKLQLVERKDYALLGMETSPAEASIAKQAVLVISNEQYGLLSGSAAITRFELYQIDNARKAEALSQQVHAIVSQTTPGAYYSSFADIYTVQLESSSLLLFASSFLALIALFALASVIYFKQLREATEEQQQVQTLVKLGVDDRQIRGVIRRKLLFVFAPPLVLGIVHSWFIIKTYILDSLTDYPSLSGMVWGINLIYVGIYCFFYLSSTNLYYKIVNQKL